MGGHIEAAQPKHKAAAHDPLLIIPLRTLATV